MKNGEWARIINRQQGIIIIEIKRISSWRLGKIIWIMIWLFTSDLCFQLNRLSLYYDRWVVSFIFCFGGRICILDGCLHWLSILSDSIDPLLSRLEWLPPKLHLLPRIKEEIGLTSLFLHANRSPSSSLFLQVWELQFSSSVPLFINLWPHWRSFGFLGWQQREELF